MPGGYVGKILYVDLSQKKLEAEPLNENLARSFIGGYGLGARVLFQRMPPKADPLGPENILGLVTGPLTGTPILFGTRYTVVAKSPLTGTWGDANSGGDFGPVLKLAGYDSVFFHGVAEKPVFLLLDDGRAELRDAHDLWGKDSFQTEEWLHNEFGRKAKVVCIGPAGEKRSLIASVMNDRGRAAGRSGLGAVMGAKRLKAVVARGQRPIHLAQETEAKEIRQRQIGQLKDSPFAAMLKEYGTAGILIPSTRSGDAPVKNWAGAGPQDFLQVNALGAQELVKFQERRYGCWRCPVACGGQMKAGKGKYRYEAGAHKPEYETLAAFGTLCLNADPESIIKLNDLCNRYGIDTISAGAVVAFAMECYEKEILGPRDTDGLELRWGNVEAIVALTEKIAKREGFGELLADGVKRAAERIGRGAEQYAIHIQGQELPMHDPKLRPGWATAYLMDATPGRHTQGSAHLVERGMAPKGIAVESIQPFQFAGKGQAHRKMSAFVHVLTSAGLCLFGMYSGIVDGPTLVDSLHATTGWDITLDEILETGDRIATVRHAFNLREGLNPLQFQVPGRLLGKPALDKGPLRGVNIDLDTQVRDYLVAMDWDLATAKPSRKRLLELGLEEVAEALGV